MIAGLQLRSQIQRSVAHPGKGSFRVYPGAFLGRFQDDVGPPGTKAKFVPELHPIYGVKGLHRDTASGHPESTPAVEGATLEAVVNVLLLYCIEKGPALLNRDPADGVELLMLGLALSLDLLQ